MNSFQKIGSIILKFINWYAGYLSEVGAKNSFNNLRK